MFQVKSIDITNKEDPKNCELKINWDGIELFELEQKKCIYQHHQAKKKLSAINKSCPPSPKQCYLLKFCS